MRNPSAILLFATILSLAVPAQAVCVAIQWNDSTTGNWGAPGAIGFGGAQWQPHDVDDGERSPDLMTVDITLEWTNGPDGAADFGIAVGTSTGFQYWNQEFQTSMGDHSETLRLERGDLLDVGWDGESLQIGPSISTGAVAPLGLAYELSWTISYSEPCDDTIEVQPEGFEPERPEGDSDSQAQSNPFRWGFLLLVPLVVGIVVWLSSRK